MVVRKRFVWLLCAALFVVVVPMEATAKWAPMHEGDDPTSSPWVGPGGTASPDPKGGADPDEPLGPERTAGTRTLLVPATPTTLSSLVVTLMRLHWVTRLGR